MLCLCVLVCANGKVVQALDPDHRVQMQPRFNQSKKTHMQEKKMCVCVCVCVCASLYVDVNTKPQPQKSPTCTSAVIKLSYKYTLAHVDTEYSRHTHTRTHTHKPQLYTTITFLSLPASLHFPFSPFP